MKILKFRLYGRTAFFKKPDVNTYVYFTYGSIHKIALIGMLGAIVGLKGYNQMNMENDKSKKFPEFYEKLHDIKVAIEPNEKTAFLNKKVQIFNNSVGYASQEAGGNLIVKEQWLENPSWNIYIQIDSEITRKIMDYICNRKAIFCPYLGKNDHYANITDIEVIDNVEETTECTKIHSLCPKNNVQFSFDEDDEDDDIEEEEIFKYEERLPLELEENTNGYILESFVCSNMKVSALKDIKAYKVKEKNIVFF